MDAATSSSRPVSEGQGPAGSVLLVEDDPVLAQILERYLEARGYDLRLAGSAEDAGRQLDRGFRPGLVILDLNLPGDTGWSLIRSPELVAAGSPPVLVATATGVSPRRLREHGVAGYLPKPFPLETLLTTIERLIKPMLKPA
jgi:two-component system, OmpR family, phosphate regulon response regulator OmpR